MDEHARGRVELILDYFKEAKILTQDGKEEDEQSPSIVFECDVKNQEDIDNFLDFYMNETNEIMKIKVKKTPGQKSIYAIKSIYRCHFDTRYENTRDAESILRKDPSKRFKNTMCPFQISFKVIKCPSHSNASCQLTMTYEHNHPVNSLEALSFKRISEEILIEVQNLFEKGNTPSQAYQEFLRTLKLHCEDQIKFHLSKADRSKCPRRRDFNSLYIKFCKEKFGGKNGADMFEKLKERINQFEENMDGIKVAYQLYNEDENSALILAILTPLMIRVHRMVRESSEIVFIDSTSNLDEHNLRFFLLVTHSVAGALPLGIIITSDEREETIVKALTLYKGILPEEAFYNSPTGPDIFMTDNCGELRNSLHKIWPDSTLLLCIFHILQQVWRWLYDKNHGVSQNDRVEIMKLFKNVIYALNLEEFEETSVLLQESNVTSKYEHCISYFEELFSLSKKSYDTKSNVKEIASDLFTVKSKSDEKLDYVVDMSIGVCECVAGRDGSPCWHQCILWKEGFARSGNFLPKFDKFERKRFAEIALGESLDISYYESIHSDINIHDPEIYKSTNLESTNDQNMKQPRNIEEAFGDTNDNKTDLALNHFGQFSEAIVLVVRSMEGNAQKSKFNQRQFLEESLASAAVKSKVIPSTEVYQIDT
ncbi:uncharacterized protein [Clytia hemisphaerica]|uniref:uncharacterized protein n=1 Tax=Clytia hemisphaerica TaxID=252671 RepID=UPI0034D74475